VLLLDARQIGRNERPRSRDVGGHPHLGIPRDDAPVGVEAGVHVERLRRAFGIPAVLVGAHPLHAHGGVHHLRNQHRIRGHIVVAVPAVRSGAGQEDDARLSRRQPEQLRQIVAQRVRPLGRRPDRGPVVAHIGDGAARRERRMALERPPVTRLQLFGRFRQSLRGIAPADEGLVLIERRFPNVLIEVIAAGQAFPFAPRGLEVARGADRRPFVLCGHRQKVSAAHHARIRNGFDGRFIHREQLRAEGRWPHYARMQHPGDRVVLQVNRGSGALAGNIGTRQRLADNRVVGRILKRRVGIGPQVELAVSHQLTEVGVGPELVERPPRRRRRLADFHAAARQPRAAARATRVGGQRGIALDHRNALHGDAELFGGHLRNRDQHAGADIHQAGIDGHCAVAVDSEEAVELAGVDGLTGALRCGPLAEREADHNGGRGAKKISA